MQLLSDASQRTLRSFAHSRGFVVVVVVVPFSGLQKGDLVVLTSSSFATTTSSVSSYTAAVTIGSGGSGIAVRVWVLDLVCVALALDGLQRTEHPLVERVVNEHLRNETRNTRTSPQYDSRKSQMRLDVFTIKWLESLLSNI